MSSVFCEVTVSSVWLLRATGISCSSTVLQGADCQHMMAATFCVGSLAVTLSRLYVAKMSALTFVSWGGGGGGWFVKDC
jgi:hypothetical protein